MPLVQRLMGNEEAAVYRTGFTGQHLWLAKVGTLRERAAEEMVRA